MIPSAVWIFTSVEVLDSSSSPPCILMGMRYHMQSLPSIGILCLSTETICHLYFYRLVTFIDLR